MTNDLNHKRIHSIYQMLFEMAAGNFNFKIKRSEADDELEALVVLVNIVAEELRASLFHRGYINTHFSFQYLVQNTLVLDNEFIIQSYSPDVPENLQIAEDYLKGKPFSSILDDVSIPVWNLVTGPILWDAYFHLIIQLNFKTPDGLIIPAFCTVTRLLHSSKILISSITIVVEDSFAPNPVLLNSSSDVPDEDRKYDAKLIQHVYDYILDNLETPLPSVQELSKIFGTNEYDLKDGFRHFFNTSIYQFYNEERLKRAHLLIQQTTSPLKSIAFMCGFMTYTAFSKAFRKRFNYSPKVLLRRPFNVDDYSDLK